MQSRRIALFVLLPAALLGAAALFALAAIALQAAMAVGSVEGGLMAWMLAFVVGLPLLVLPLLALARWLSSRIRERKSRGRDNHFPLLHRGAP